MQKQMENEMETGLYRVFYRDQGFPIFGVHIMMENQMQKQMENEMETGLYRVFYRD